MTIRMHKKVKITVLRTEYYQNWAEQYAIPNLEKCPFHQKGQVLYSDGINPVSKPEWVEPDTSGSCAWHPCIHKGRSTSYHGEAQMVQEFPRLFTGYWRNRRHGRSKREQHSDSGCRN